jgi:uncharacterized membrane protein
MHGILRTVTFVAVLGAGTIGGVFFAFSSFVLPALARLPATQGIDAMQRINVVVLNRSFLGVFLGTAVLSAVLLLATPWNGGTGGRWLALATLLYLVGTIGVTMVCNVPRNEQLAAIVPTAPDAARIWVDYVREWGFWNTVRTSASLAACASFVVALLR